MEQQNEQIIREYLKKHEYTLAVGAAAVSGIVILPDQNRDPFLVQAHVTAYDTDDLLMEVVYHDNYSPKWIKYDFEKKYMSLDAEIFPNAFISFHKMTKSGNRFFYDGKERSKDEIQRDILRCISIVTSNPNKANYAWQTIRTLCPVDKREGNKDQFHMMDASGKVKGVFDYEIFSYIKGKYNIIVIGGIPYLYDGGCYHADENGARLKSLIRDCIYPEFIKAPTINRIYDLFLQDTELQVKFPMLNAYPSHWINFQNGFYDPIENRIIPHDPKYKAVNQIPHCFKPGNDPGGRKTDEWLDFSIPDAQDKEMILQYAGYSMTKDIRQQKFLIIKGEGGTGKSTFIKLLEYVVGSENISNISLSELSQRFASFGLIGKLLNSCADLEIDALEDTSTLKKALGEDSLRGEAKGKNAISFKTYAKLIFSTNELPIVKSERTNGFYRRILILTMNRLPKKKDVNLSAQLEKEVDHFIFLCMEALRRMYQSGYIAESENSIEAVKRFRMESDTVESFLIDDMEKDVHATITRGKLFEYYTDYCYRSGRTALTKNNFFRAMRAKGYTDYPVNGTYIFSELQVKNRR